MPNLSAAALLVERIDAALPQTQCTRCGYPDCRSYAEAIAGGAADINQCPPGGAEGVARLAAITGRGIKPLNPANGLEGPRRVAVIDEAWCIGCTLCIKACPVDCILGGPKAMHTVVREDCTGCELCLPACPVDCIDMIGTAGAGADHTGWDAWSPVQAERARSAYAARQRRRGHGPTEAGEATESRESGERAATATVTACATASTAETSTDAGSPEHKRAVIQEALARAREQRSRQGP
jgi:Na+-translocating ferredoxin:NAD+ oxidoreductase subunit B